MPKAAKGKQSKLRSALQQVQQRKAKVDAARRAMENNENKRKSIAKSKGGRGSNKKRKRGPYFPYRKHNTILLIGEGNFSFASSIAKRLGSGVNVVATAYDSEQIVAQKYSGDAAKHIAEFESFGGTVLYDIDGTALEGHSELRGKRFTHIVFNFPHAGAGIKDQVRNIQTNQLLIAGFFSSALPFLTTGMLPSATRRRSSTAGRKQPTSKLDRGGVDGGTSSGTDSGGDSDGSDHDGAANANRVNNGTRRSRTKISTAGSNGEFEFEGAKATVVYDEGDNSDSDAEFGFPGNCSAEAEDADDTQSEFRPNLDCAGQIHVTLKSGLPYEQWNIKRLAKETGLASYKTYPFELDAFPGYEHRRTLGFKEGVSKDENQEIRDKAPKLYAFCAKPVAEAEQTGEHSEVVAVASATEPATPSANSAAKTKQSKPKQSKPKRMPAINSESYDYKSLVRKRR
ncbi:hypothetical protein GGI04_001023 [Coemansia thaxteri]|nr:hypothetical protein GGI04_001023 [Coemansia thaxteri]KAJ2472224.1 hypothetical protein GGI02_001728 [Coemansia sp. RSA 2322]